MRKNLPEKFWRLTVETGSDLREFKKKKKSMYEIGMLVRIRLRGVWRKAKIVDRSDQKILVVYKGDHGFSEEWITPSTRNQKKTHEATRSNTLGEKLKEMQRNESKKQTTEKFNWRIRRWLESSDSLMDVREKETKEKIQDTKCPEIGGDDDVPESKNERHTKNPMFDFKIRDMLRPDKKPHSKRSNNNIESKFPSPPKRLSFTNSFDRTLLEKIRISERELRKMTMYHRYQ
jgi:hypothetical protein